MTKVDRKKEYPIRAWILQQEKEHQETRRLESEPFPMTGVQKEHLPDEKKGLT